MGRVHSGYLNLLMAFLAAMTLSLPARAEVYSELPISPATGQMLLTQARYGPGALPGPAQRPLCHLRCRGFIAAVPDAPQQPQAGTAVALEILVTHLPLAMPAVPAAMVTISPPGDSPPRSNVLRL